jgi:hemerythrin-like domain-containing protein
MSNTKALFRTAAADFDHPLEMLAACHDRIEERCDLLERLIDHLRQSGADREAQQAAANVIRYFDTAGENHHEDEEDDLFPQLLARDRQAAEALVSRLLAEHRDMRAAWAGLRAPLARIAAGESALLDAAEVERFGTLYRRHIDVEERELLPLAGRLLDVNALAATGAAMARRRGVKT